MNKNNTTAIFIDGGWLYGVSRQIDEHINYADLYNNLINDFGKKTTIYFYGSINPDDKRQVKFYDYLKKLGYKVYFAKPIKRGTEFISKGLDISLTVNAIKILPSLKKFVLISGDGDFASLIELASSSVETIIIGIPFSTSYLLRRIKGVRFLNFETIGKNKKIKSTLLKKEKFIAPISLCFKRGDCYKSYKFIKKLMSSAKRKITIIDSYIDEQILDMVNLLDIKINIDIFTADKQKLKDLDLQVEKLEKDGRIIKVYKTNEFHARFLVVDDDWWYSDHSFKNLGEKCSLLTKPDKKISKELSGIIDKIKTTP